MGRYENEVRPVVFRMMDALVAYTTRIGIDGDELERAVFEWLSAYQGKTTTRRMK